MSNSLRHVFSPTRFSAAEAILGVVSLVLVIWLLWPESQSPKLDQRATWQQHIEEAGRQRSKDLEALRPVLEAEIAVGNPQETGTAVSKTGQSEADHLDNGQPSAKPPRRALTKPSELADRYDYIARVQPAAIPAARRETFEQAPSDVKQNPTDPASGEGDAGVGAVQPSETETAATDGQIDPSGQAEQSPSRPDEQPSSEIKVAVYTSEVQELLSELEQSPKDNDTAPATSLSNTGGFDVESGPSTHVRQRPRDDAPSWLKHAVTASLADDRPVIAIVIDDLGVNRSGTKAFNDLPSPLTLAFLPYAGNIEAQTAAAREAGHELLVHLPMEPFGSEWPGPDALIASLDHDEFVDRLETNLNRIKDYVGVNNHMGSRLTTDRGRMDLVMRELRKRDVLFLDSKTSARSVAGEMASRNGVPNTTRDVFLDHVIDIDKIRSQMALIERIARRTGSAVAIGHPHTATIQALKDWLPKLAERGFTLAPLSAVIARRACNDELLIATETCGRYLQAQQPDAPSITAGGG